MAHGDLTQGMANGGHILFGNHEITQTDTAIPITHPYPVQTRHVAEMDPTTESHPVQRHRQRNITNQDIHE